MHLSINREKTVSTFPSQGEDNIDQWEGAMSVAAQQIDVPLLTKVLQQRLGVLSPSGDLLQVKCAVKSNRLMILTEHRLGARVDSGKIFAVLEEAIGLLIIQKPERVEFFIRNIGEELPYAKRGISFGKIEVGIQNTISPPPPPPPPPPLLPLPPSTELHQEVSESLIVVENKIPQVEIPPTIIPEATPNRKPVFLGMSLAGVAATGGAAFVFTHPCVVSECKEIQNVEALNTEFKKQTRVATSEKQLLVLQKRLEAGQEELERIPEWSPRREEVRELKKNLTQQEDKINQVISALKTGELATEKAGIQAKNLEELKSRQQLWRQAINPLEVISPNHELYGLTQAKLSVYRANLRIVNQQLQIEHKSLRQLSTAKASAQSAKKLENSIKNIEELGKLTSIWKSAVDNLSAIPKTSGVYTEAQKLLVSYKPQFAAVNARLSKEESAARSYNLATSAAAQARKLEQQNQWQAAVKYWQQAVNASQQVSSDTFYYSQLQPLIVPYSAALQEAFSKQKNIVDLQKTRNDLNNTCSRVGKICKYTLDAKKIAVIITPDYEKALQQASFDSQDPNVVISVTAHLETLQQALEVISDNANLPLIVSDSQGKTIHTHSPVNGR